MLGAISRLIAAMIPGALYIESISGRAHRSDWRVSRLIDKFLGDNHCRQEFEWEKLVRELAIAIDRHRPGREDHQRDQQVAADQS
ncbi:hypothetical protein [Mesorhizobium sp. WSM2239]|uniref:Uncharacterized protein n=2 Tax=unclassified Mesorhizobium TaxID=325217 RepID=A0AAU8D0E4_9HYPH